MASFFSRIKRTLGIGGELAPWQNYSSRNITSRISHYHVRGFTSKLVGKIFATDGEPVISFRREDYNFEKTANIQASSTDFQISIDVKHESFAIYFNEKPLGVLRQSGNLLNPKGEVIGSAVHPMKASMSIGSAKVRFGSTRFPLNINGRQLATIWVSPEGSVDSLMTDLIVNENAAGHTILQVHHQPTKEEEQWLIALAIIEVAYHGQWMIGV